MTPDNINSLFEMGGALVSCLSVRKLWQDKTIRGVSVWPSVFFATWGAWNLGYYPSLGQVWSQAAASLLLAVNFVWLVSAAYFYFAGWRSIR